MPSATRRKAPRRSRSAAPPPPPPREFSQARARATYVKILAAALALYTERGYYGTQTPDIAERAGLSVGGLYRYFRDKHQIFIELMHRGLERNRVSQDEWIAALEEHWDSGTLDVPRAVDQIVDWTWDQFRRLPPDLLRTYMAMSYQDETFARLRDDYDRYERQAFARVVRKLLPPARQSSAIAVAKLIDIIVETLAVWATIHSGGPSRGLKEATKEVLTIYLAPVS